MQAPATPLQFCGICADPLTLVVFTDPQIGRVRMFGCIGCAEVLPLLPPASRYENAPIRMAA